jgi:hypothetical protein
MRGYQYPKCCKIYNINDFDYDSASCNWPSYKVANYNDQKKKVEKYEKKFGCNYPNVLITAAVTCRQMVAKNVLDDLGYELVQEINNKSGDGIVYFYKKLLQREPNTYDRKYW